MPITTGCHSKKQNKILQCSAFQHFAVPKIVDKTVALINFVGWHLTSQLVTYQMSVVQTLHESDLQ